jgi:Holliday junction DNA helicase RuvA
MIHFVEGYIEESNPSSVIINVNGIGYQIHISLFTYEKIKNLNECRLLTYFLVKEDAQQLYGFFDGDEKAIFSLLITVSGIGASTAQSILSSLGTNEIKNAILSGNSVKFTSVKGIGGKTAQRMILELKDKMLKVELNQEDIFSKKSNNLKDEALSALLTLGFNKNSAEKAINEILQEKEVISTEEIIRIALKRV